MNFSSYIVLSTLVVAGVVAHVGSLQRRAVGLRVSGTQYRGWTWKKASHAVAGHKTCMIYHMQDAVLTAMWGC